MTKSRQIRAIFRQHTAVFTNDVAREVGCTQPLVFQVIDAMRDEGSIFDAKQVGRRRSYRLLPEDEARTRRAAQRQFEEDHRRRQEFAKVKQQLAAAMSSVEDALQTLGSLSP